MLGPILCCAKKQSTWEGKADSPLDVEWKNYQFLISAPSLGSVVLFYIKTCIPLSPLGKTEVQADACCQDCGKAGPSCSRR